MNPVLEKTIEEHDNPCAYIEILELDHVTPKAVLEDLKNIPKYNQFEKVAIVGDAKWKALITDTVSPFMKPATKC